MNNEPVITTASVTAAVAAVIALLLAFGIPLTDDQQKALLAAVAVLGPMVSGVVARRHVTPVSRHRKV